MTSEKISGLVIRALKCAINFDDVGETEGLVNRNRSKNFVEQLGGQFSLHYEKNENVRVLTKHNGENRPEFGLNELLFDVLVCEVSTVPSATTQKDITFVAKGLWAVESEMAKNSREAMYDFNKLVLSSSENLLFVGPLVSDNESFIAPIERAAQHCSKPAYIVLIPHPSTWGQLDGITETDLFVRQLNQ